MIPADIEETIARAKGVLLLSDALAAGLSSSRLYRHVARGELTLIMPGCFARADRVQALDAWQHFALRGRAFALSHDAFLTGWAATKTFKLPTLGRPPALPTAIRRNSHRHGSRRTDHGRLVSSGLPAQHRFRIGRLLIASPAWSVADVIRTSRLPDGLLVADATVRRGIEFGAVIGHMGRWPGVGKLRWVAEHADPAVESPLESLGRFTFYEFEFPIPVPNAWVGRDGPEFRVDGLLPWHWWVTEGDGAKKYDNRSDASHIVRKQTEREYRLRRMGLDFLRYGWSDVYPDRAAFAVKIAEMFRDHPPRKEPMRWWKEVQGVGAVEPRDEDWPSPKPYRIWLPTGWREDGR